MSRNTEKHSYTNRQETWAQRRKKILSYKVSNNQVSSKSSSTSNSSASSSHEVNVSQKLDAMEQRLKTLETYLQKITEELLILRENSETNLKSTEIIQTEEKPKTHTQINSVKIQVPILEADTEVPETDPEVPEVQETISDTELAFILEEPESTDSVTSKQRLSAPKLKPKEIKIV